MKRCDWLNLNNPLYVEYHDNEWGEIERDDKKLFEMLILEGAQAGLSWETVLKKRENYKLAFDNFDAEKISKYDEIKQEELMLNPGIIRNKLKIISVTKNAKAFLEIQKEFGSFYDYLWRFIDNKQIVNNFEKLSDYQTKTSISDAISKDLKKRGMNFVGSTIIYAFMQAVGMTNDHGQGCFKCKK
ncbi:MAG: DNA-3-methyladenine glycosylase I [Candidatus Gracilibacteria bacterium]|nr:DNA-3-methyladenine glycosylase I [Candidatus Gracilibacteria bacterium]